MTRLLFATNNAHKIAEVRAALGSSVEVLGLKEAGIHIDIAEPHHTLEENARAKSSAIFALTAMSCFSEDSGLEVDALQGEPGVHSAHYAGPGRSAADNMRLLLEKLQGITNRSAQFRTVISLIWAGTEHVFEGVCEGRILEEAAGEQGFGYDPVFAPAGEQRSFAQMTLDEKNAVSHRRKAVDKLVLFLQQQSQNNPAGSPAAR